MARLVERLNQRKLVPWALAYAVGAFASMQGFDIVARRPACAGVCRRVAAGGYDCAIDSDRDQ